jgi:hypothetical protein
MNKYKKIDLFRKQRRNRKIWKRKNKLPILLGGGPTNRRRACASVRQHAMAAQLGANPI